VRLASVRRSLFTNETERAKFLNHLAGGTLELLRTQQGLADHANYHEFCRLLGRLKTNYQLSELVNILPFWRHSGMEPCRHVAVHECRKGVTLTAIISGQCRSLLVC